MRIITGYSAHFRRAAIWIIISLFIYVPPPGCIPPEVCIEIFSQYLTGSAIGIPSTVTGDILSVRPFNLIRTVS